MFLPTNMPCAECGASVPRAAADSHTCDPSRRLEFQIRAMASAVATFESDLLEYLACTEGQFEMWLAAREVRRAT